MKRTRVVNGLGIGYAGLEGERVRDIRIYNEGGAVQFWVEVAGFGLMNNEAEIAYEAMQYLTPEEAMAVAKALERCAIQALRETAE
jgi:hypothetical protein